MKKREKLLKIMMGFTWGGTCVIAIEILIFDNLPLSIVIPSITIPAIATILVSILWLECRIENLVEHPKIRGQNDRKNY